MAEQQEERKSLYQLIIDHLMDRINSNQFTFETPLCTEKQLMEEFQVSRITAKRAITELEYQGILYRRRGAGSFVARDIFERTHLIRRESRIFPMILPFNATQDYILDMIQRINRQIGTADCFLSLFITGRNSAREQAVLSQLLEQNVAGLLYYPCSGDIHLELLHHFVLRNIPVIVLDQTVTPPYLHNVLCDNCMGGRLLTEYLISLGHTRIAFLSATNIGRLSSISERFGGYLFSMREAGLRVSAEDVVQELRASSESQERQLLETQLRRLCGSGVTAVECENDGVARAVLNCCEALSIRVPEDLSICGFDANDPGITSIYQNEVEMAREIGRIILDSVNGNPLEGRKIHVPAKLMPAGSTGPCRADAGRVSRL